MPCLQTTYEIVAEHPDGRRYCVRFASRKSIRGMVDAVRAMAPHLLRVCGLPETARMEDCRTNGGLPSCRIDAWAIRFTGRTDIGSRGDRLPWIGRVE